MKFSLSKAVAAASPHKGDNKREAPPESKASRSKALKLADVKIEDGPKPSPQNTRKLSASAPVQIVIYKTTDSAGFLWDRFKGTEQPLWQIQISHDTPRPITYHFRDRISDFLRTSDGLPDTLRELEDECGIRLLIGDLNEFLFDLKLLSLPALCFHALTFCTRKPKNVGPRRRGICSMASCLLRRWQH